ncbi:MAG: hypothetical protein ACM3U2_20535 [Deltaproteobacteria bacterium]
MQWDDVDLDKGHALTRAKNNKSFQTTLQYINAARQLNPAIECLHVLALIPSADAARAAKPPSCPAAAPARRRPRRMSPRLGRFGDHRVTTASPARRNSLPPQGLEP